MQIGCPEPTSGYEAATVASSSFRGFIHEMKLYRRVLTPEEFKQACGVTSDSLWAIGSKNGSATEFSDADPAAVFEPATMNWSRFRKTLTAENPSVSIVCNLTEQDREVPRVLELAPMSTDFPAGGRLSVSVNGSVVKTFEPEMGVDKLVYISVNRLKGLTKVGNVYPMTITLTREGVMSGSLSFDRLLIGGWQLGTRDTSAAEFCGWIGNDTYCLNPYYISKGNLKQAFTVLYPGAANPKQNHNEIYFSLSEKMASDCSFVVRMRYEGNTGEFDFFLNGEHLGMKHPAYRADFDIVIPKGVAKAGVNEFKVVQNTRDYSGACNTDYMRFSPVKEWHDPALLLLIR